MNIPVVHKYIDILKGISNNMILAPTGHLGISRDQMPQIDSKHRESFIKFLKNKGVSVRLIRVPAKSLKIVQGEYNRDKVGAIIAQGLDEFASIFISKDGYVVDGNHRLIAKLNCPGGSNYMNVTELGMDIRPLLELIHEFPGVRYRNLNDK